MSSEPNPATDFSRTAVIALGSNQGDSPALLQRAIQCLQELSNEPLRASSFYRTAPMDCPAGSPDFVNAVALLVPQPHETPVSLLQHLHEIEANFGRERGGTRNAPRPLDLDLISFGEARIETEALTLPHPRAHLRRFVLEPLVELAPDLKLPGFDQTVSKQLAGLPSEGVSRLG